jgi:NADH-quinone oxidoreductase subunit J
MVPLALLALSHAPALRQPVEDVNLHAPAAIEVAPVLQPMLILMLCLIAGVGTILLLPGRVTVAWRRLGAVAALASLVILLLAMFVSAERRPVVYFWVFSALAVGGSLRVITHPRPVYSALYFVLTVFASAGLFVLLWAEFMAVALVVIYAGAILVTYTFVIMLAADAAPPRTGDAPQAARDFAAEHDRIARRPVAASAVGFLTLGILLFVIYDRAPGTLERRLSVTDPAYLAAARQTEPRTALGADVQAPERANPQPAPSTAGNAPRGDLYPANQQSSYANERGGIQSLGIYLFTRQMLSLQLAGLMLTIAMIGAIVIARRQIIPELRPMGLSEAERGGEDLRMPFTPVSDDPHSLPVHGTDDPRQKAYPQT